MQPKISIITISYNSEKYIEKAILSVINQSYQNKEYIIIDGASKDSTVDIIKRYKDHISHFISEPDQGISDAFNKGILAATGDIIGILNSDDYMMPNALAEVASYYEDGVDIYRGHCVIENAVLKTKKRLYPNNNFYLPPIGAVICHESAFITPKLYQKIGLYDIKLKYTMDLDLFIRIYKSKVVSKNIDVCVINFRTGGTSSIPAIEFEHERKYLIFKNGGNLFQAFIYILYNRIKYLIKRIYYNLH